jgi:hypothetical protein
VSVARVEEAGLQGCAVTAAQEVELSMLACERGRPVREDFPAFGRPLTGIEQVAGMVERAITRRAPLLPRPVAMRGDDARDVIAAVRKMAHRCTRSVDRASGWNRHEEPQGVV